MSLWRPPSPLLTQGVGGTEVSLEAIGLRERGLGGGGGVEAALLRRHHRHLLPLALLPDAVHHPGDQEVPALLPLHYRLEYYWSNLDVQNLEHLKLNATCVFY